MMMLRAGHYDAIDKNTRNLDLPRVERSALGNALNLGDDQTTAIVCGHGDRQHL